MAARSSAIRSTARRSDGLGTFGPEIAPAQITADQNNYNPTGFADASIVLLATDVSRNITGLVRPPVNSILFKKTIINVGNFDVVLKFNDAGSAEGNRIFPSTAADLTLSPTEAALFYYDTFTFFAGAGTIGGWRAFKLGAGAAAGVTSLAFNGGPALAGAIAIRSPMAANTGASPVRIDNGNVKELAAAATVIGIDVDLNQSFHLVADQNLAMAIPTASIITTPRDGEKITFSLTTASETFRTITWTGGAGGYRFSAVASPQGVKVADFNTLMALVNSTKLMKIGFEYDAAFNFWCATALAGYWE
jgi:hypothetical protein